MRQHKEGKAFPRGGVLRTNKTKRQDQEIEGMREETTFLEVRYPGNIELVNRGRVIPR